MFTVTEEVSIACSVNEVFDFFMDGRNRPKWDPAVIFEELTSPAPVRVGSTIHTRMRVMGQEVDLHWRVAEFTPPTQMVIVSTAGPMPISLNFELAARDGACTVTATVEGSPTGLMRIAEPLTAESVSSTFAASLARAKALLEQPV